MFELSSQPLDTDTLRSKLTSAQAGALVSFEGRVRNNNEGKAVVRLEYEAYAAMAEKEAARIIEETRRQFGIIDLYCVHRVGSLSIGEVAIWAGVLAGHRGEAFSACRYLIDEIKARVPIWKKEFYADGSTSWVNSATAAPTQPDGR